jgi:hypothetical protein
MSSNRYKCIKVTICDGICALTFGKIYIISLEVRDGLNCMVFIGDDGRERRWSSYYLKQFELVSNKVEGLCAPTAAPQRKVKGAIFDTGYNSSGRYFLAHCQGGTDIKSSAYVYSCDEIRRFMKGGNWARKCDGKWILVYE